MYIFTSNPVLDTSTFFPIRPTLIIWILPVLGMGADYI